MNLIGSEVTDVESGRKTLNTADRDRDKDSKRQGQSLLQRNWRPFYILVNIAVDSVAIMMAGIAAFAIRQMIVSVPLMTMQSVWMSR